MDSQNGLKSCLYECKIMHHRFAPKVHKFNYGAFYFCVDLDEIAQICRSNRLIRHNQWGLYSFYEEDFIDQTKVSLKAKVLNFVASNSQTLSGQIERVAMLTSPRVFGYIFNPVSIYYCLDGANKLICAIAEVTNTFREAKLYFLTNEISAADNQSVTAKFQANPATAIASDTDTDAIKTRLQKLFYVSPFSPLDTFFDFLIDLPAEKLLLNINTVEGSETVLASSVQGKRRPLSSSELIRLTLFYPLMSLRVISLIHLHAFKLFLKGVPFIFKEADPGLQIDVRKPHKSLQVGNTGFATTSSNPRAKSSCESAVAAKIPATSKESRFEPEHLTERMSP